MILGIESSCDETAIALLSDGTIIDEQVASQVRAHAKHGGVVPELAARMHVEAIHPLLERSQKEANWSYADLSKIAVTVGPGLETALLVGTTVAQTLGMALGIPVVGVNHLHGHIYSSFLSDPAPEYPFVALLVSGGHSMLIHVKAAGDFEVLGQSVDDACGEAFDKVARLLELGYPGGPKIEAAAKDGREDAIAFPRPMLKDGLRFSFSGLKTAVRQYLAKEEADSREINVADVAASFQAAVRDVLVHKAIQACEQVNSKCLVMVGGVAANQCIRDAMERNCAEQGIQFLTVPRQWCTDNAAMIAKAAEMLDGITDYELKVHPSFFL